MSEIPEDIRFVAKGVLCDLADAREKSMETLSPFWSGEEACGLISRALLAERERCAKIARTMFTTNGMAAGAGQCIAARIRTPSSE